MGHLSAFMKMATLVTSVQQASLSLKVLSYMQLPFCQGPIFTDQSMLMCKNCPLL